MAPRCDLVAGSGLIVVARSAGRQRTDLGHPRDVDSDPDAGPGEQREPAAGHRDVAGGVEHGSLLVDGEQERCAVVGVEALVGPDQGAAEDVLPASLELGGRRLQEGSHAIDVVAHAFTLEATTDSHLVAMASALATR